MEQMKQIEEQVTITKEEFLNNYLKYYNAIESPPSKIKLFNCNMTGYKINTLSDMQYIQYKDGYTYKWEMIVEYIEYIYSIYGDENIKFIEYEDTYMLDIDYNGHYIRLEFYKNFEKSFHSYISHQYHPELIKYLIFPVYKDLVDVKPYIKASNLKYIKKHFSHGDIVYTGDNHYILKNITKDSKKWKSCDYSDEYDEHIFIPYEYIQSRGYTYYISQMAYFDIAPLPLDIMNNEVYDFHLNNIDCNVDEFVDDTMTSQYYLDNQEKKEDIKVDESSDIVSAYFGELVIKEEKLYVHITEETTMELPSSDIAPHFIKAKGYTYYYNVAQECGYELMVLISPLEVLNLKTMELKRMV